MSHYTVLVIGADPEEQLAPYDENMEVDPYKSYADSDLLRTFERIYREDEGEEPPEDYHEFAARLRKKWHAHLSDAEIAAMTPLQLAHEGDLYLSDETGIYSWSTYNPKSKWDWYTVGGRWRGYFKLRDWASDTEAWNTIHDEAVARGLDHEQAAREADRYMEVRTARPAVVGASGVFGNAPQYDADEVVKGDVDAEGMRVAAAESAAEWWERMDKLLSDLPEAKPWFEFTAKVTEAAALCGASGTPTYTIEQAREEYAEQPRVRALREHDERIRRMAHTASKKGKEQTAQRLFAKTLGDVMHDGIEDYQLGREEHIKRARENAIAPFAYLRDGEWEAPGKMGWFGMSDDDLLRARWNREFNEMFDALPADTPLTLMDLHI